MTGIPSRRKPEPELLSEIPVIVGSRAVYELKQFSGNVFVWILRALMLTLSQRRADMHRSKYRFIL
jgi:hypothetical protein